MTSRTSSDQFDSSKELRSIFHEQFDRWQRKNFGGLEELAKRCGVSTQYLSQVKRYGRIPGKPVLILLALNFEIEKPEYLFLAAGIKEPWVYEEGIRLGKIPISETGFLSLKVDMEGFTNSIKAMIRSEIQPRGVQDLLGSRPLRIGLYPSYYWLYDKKPEFGSKVPSGIMTEFCRLLALSLQREVHTEIIPFSQHLEALKRGTIDLYGPKLFTPLSATEAVYTRSIQQCGISILFSKKLLPDLPSLPEPSSLKDLIEKPYRIAVLKDSLPQLLANSKLRKSDEELLLCETDEEAVDRMLVRGARKGAHLFLCNALIGREFLKQHKKDLTELFNTKATLIDLADIMFAVRPDLNSILPEINNAMTFLLERGGFRDRIAQKLSGDLAPLCGF